MIASTFRRWLPVIIILLSTMATVRGADDGLKTNESLLAHLDSIIAGNDRLIREKDERIASLRRKYAQARTSVERLGAAHRLYEEYVVYNSDSALHYASQARRLAMQSSPTDNDLIAGYKMDEAFIYIVLGLNDQAMALLKTIDTQTLSDPIKATYYELMAYAHSMRAVYLHSNKSIWRENLNKANSYRDSIPASEMKNVKEWQWVPVAMAIDSEEGDVRNVDITKLKEAVDGDRSPARENAINAYWLARYYKETGDNNLMVRYMTLAATYDALIVNREIAAIQDLASYLFDHGQVNRAYNYLLYADNQANMYHNRYRMISLTDVLPGVREAYRTEIEKRDSRLYLLVVILAILSVVLIGCTVFIVMEMRKLRKTKDLLHTTNETLNRTVEKRDEAIEQLENTNLQLFEANERLSEANTKLSEANKQKLGILAYAIKLTTDHIQALEDYRKKLLKKYKVKKIDDLGVLINDPELLKDRYNGFYEGFDKMILSIFPDFVEEYNATVSDEWRMDASAIAGTKTLNTRLRIYALKRLGVTKSSDIAAMLNLSIRTVYNNKGA